MKTCATLVLAFVMAVVIIGCALPPTRPLTRETTSGVKLSEEAISKVKEGVTTKTELLELFGPPSTLSLTGNGKEMWIYTYSLYRIPITQTVKLDPEMGPVVVNRRNPDITMQITNILLSQDGIVEKITSTTSGTQIKSKIVVE
ncbi:MAG: outer membrane protein assembly factor BamE [Deltaproteobacteria bacterium]|nr:outer membrane protein assembly factor BamE [Deltaproteobacteria bacterium]